MLCAPDLAQLLACLPDAALLTDAKGRIRQWNPAARALAGWSAEEVLGKPLGELLSAGGRPMSAARLREEARGRSVCQLSTAGRRSLWVEAAGGELAGGAILILRELAASARMIRALQDSQHRYQVVTTQTGQLVYDWDIGSGEIQWAGAVRKITGYGPREFRKVDFAEWGERLHPEDREATLAALREARRQGVPFELEYRFRRKDGSYAELEEYGVFLRDASGSAVRALGRMRDVGVRNRSRAAQQAVYAIAEAAAEVHDLRELYPRIHRIISSLMPADNLFIAQADAGKLEFLYFVDQKDQTPGGGRVQLGRGVTAYVLRTGRPLLTDEEGLAELAARGELERQGAACVSWLGVPLVIDGQAVGVLAVQSYTEGQRYTASEQEMLEFVSRQVAMAIRRLRAEDALRESEEKYRFLAESFSDVIWQTDASFRFTYVSASVGRLLGFSKEEVEGHLLFDFLPLAGRAEVQAAAQGIQPRGHYEMPMLGKDGAEVWVEVSVTPLRGPDGPIGYQGITRDIRVRKRAEAERERLEAELRQAQKMESVGQLAGGIAHDFNNLLTPILGYMDLLLPELPEGSAQTEMAQAVRHAAQRARDLTRQLLAFSRKQLLELKAVDLAQVVRGFEGILRRTLRENIELAVELPEEPLPVRADPGQMEQVLMNLALNAQDAMPTGGRLAVRAWRQTLAQQPPPAELAALAPGDYVALEVRDSGGGMDGPTLERIFEPFFTTKQKGQGTGLGLPMVYGIIKQHGGEVLVRSALKQGTRVRLLLPRVQDQEAAPEPAAARPAAHPARGSETILLAEDDAAVRELTHLILSRQGYHVLACPGGREALALGGEQLAATRLLISDVVMPGMNGRELARILRDRNRGLKVLLISGYAEQAAAQQDFLEEGIQFLPKPYSPEGLLARVRALLDEGSG